MIRFRLWLVKQLERLADWVMPEMWIGKDGDLSSMMTNIDPIDTPFARSNKSWKTPPDWNGAQGEHDAD